MNSFAPILFAVSGIFVGCLASGCTAPSYHTERQEIAVRTNAQNHVVERLAIKYTRWQYMVLLTPEGPQSSRFAEKARTFLIDDHRKETELTFLDTGYLASLERIAKAIQDTDCWLSVERRYATNSSGGGTWSLQLLVFNREKIVHKRDVATGFVEFKQVSFGPGNATLAWQTRSNHFSYKVMEDELTETGLPRSLPAK